MSRLPFAELEPAVAERIAGLGGRPLNLYRVLGNQPQLLSAWIDFAYSLRSDCRTTRVLRELMILRTAQLANSAYEWHQHRIMARQAGVPERQIAELAMWRGSTAFDARERAALRLTEDVVAGHVEEETYKAVSEVFDNGEYIELVLTASFYVMVPRVLDAIAVTSEGEAPTAEHD
jgi:alkylhydroperoxidase family enzyme